jgi:translation initiation factor IF-3
MCFREVKQINNLINEQIRAKEVRLIDENGDQAGIVSIEEALEKAHEAELDLVLIAPMANPPVCKIIDFGKFRYEQARKEKEAKKKQKVIEIKEVRLSPNIDVNDIKTKANMARKFIEKGDKVKVTLRFRGREMAHMQESRHVLDDFHSMLEDIAVIDKPPRVEGRNMVMFLTQKKN